MSKILYNLHPSEYEHPLDREALKALEKVSGLATILTKLSDSTMWKAMRIQHAGEKTRITGKNFKRVFNLFEKACEILDFSNPPELYTGWEYHVSANVFGIEEPVMYISTGCIDILDDDQLMFIIGHELGHIKSGHLLYYNLSHYIVPLLLSSVPIPNLPLIGPVLVESLKYPLYHWNRMQELSCDRAGLLCCQNKKSAMLALIALSGVPLKYIEEDFVDEFIQQSQAFVRDKFEPADKIIKSFSQAYSFDRAIYQGVLIPKTHPFPVLRIARINEWIESGEYDKLIESARDKLERNYCSKCKSLINKEDKFCGNCGAVIGSN